MRNRSGAVSVLMAVVTATASSQQPLSGPEVDVAAQRTLVQSTMTGGFAVLEQRPEIAAAGLLDLSDEQREAVQQIADDRSRALVMLLVDGIDTVRAMTDEMTQGNAAEARELMHHLHAQLDPGLPRDPLMPALSTVLSAEQVAEMRTLLDEYWSAWANAEAGRALDAAERQEAERTLSFRLFQNEVREAYDASLTRYRQALEGIYGAVEPTPEQRQAIRSIVIEHIKSTRLSPTIEERRDAYRAMYEVLDEPARTKLFDYMLVQLVREP